MAIDWRLGQMPNIAENALAAFERGREMRRQSDTGSALSTLFNAGQPGLGAPALPGPIGGYGGGTFDTNGRQVTPPQRSDVDTAWGTLARSDPRLAVQMRGQMADMQAQQQKNMREQERQRLIPLAAQGDQDAQISLMGIDPETAMRLDDRQKKQTIEATKYVANAAYQMIQMPEGQRAAAWDSYIDQGQGMYPGLAQYRGKYTPQALQSLVAQAGEMESFMKFQQPQYEAVGAGGLKGFQYGRPIAGSNGRPQEFGSPDLPAGFQIDGGPTQPASGGFPGQ